MNDHDEITQLYGAGGKVFGVVRAAPATDDAPDIGRVTAESNDLGGHSECGDGFVDEDAVIVDVTPLTLAELHASIRAHRLTSLGRDPLVTLAALYVDLVETTSRIEGAKQAAARDGWIQTASSMQDLLELLEKQARLEVSIKMVVAE